MVYFLKLNITSNNDTAERPTSGFQRAKYLPERKKSSENSLIGLYHCLALCRNITYTIQFNSDQMQLSLWAKTGMVVPWLTILHGFMKTIGWLVGLFLLLPLGA
jgi:hypothetical protein